jgi:hypothetical protein
MAAKRKSCMVPYIALATVLFLGTCPARAWEEIEGNWCSKKEGCGHWGTHYGVDVALDAKMPNVHEVGIRGSLIVFYDEVDWDGTKRRYQRLVPFYRLSDYQPENPLTIRYRDTKFVIFEGAIKPGADAKWKIEGKIKDEEGDKKEYSFKAEAVDGKYDKREEIEGTITLDDSIPKTFTGTTEATVIRRAAARLFATKLRLEGVKVILKIDGSRKRMIIVKASMKMEGGGTIIGTFTPPPDECSAAGTLRSEAQRVEKVDRSKFASLGYSEIPYSTADLRKRTARKALVGRTTGGEIEKKEKKAVLEARQEAKSRFELRLDARPLGEPKEPSGQPKGKEPKGKEKGVAASATVGGLLTIERKKERDERLAEEPGRRGRLEAASEEIKSPPLPARRLGKFQRLVEGTISKEKDKIELILPAAPILDYRCQVVDSFQGGALTLVKADMVQKVIEKPGDQPAGPGNRPPTSNPSREPSSQPPEKTGQKH